MYSKMHSVAGFVLIFAIGGLCGMVADIIYGGAHTSERQVGNYSQNCTTFEIIRPTGFGYLRPVVSRVDKCSPIKPLE